MDQSQVKNDPSTRRSLHEALRVPTKTLRRDRWHLPGVFATARDKQKRAEVWHLSGAKQDLAYSEGDLDRALCQPTYPSSAQLAQDQQP